MVLIVEQPAIVEARPSEEVGFRPQTDGLVLKRGRMEQVVAGNDPQSKGNNPDHEWREVNPTHVSRTSQLRQTQKLASHRFCCRLSARQLPATICPRKLPSFGVRVPNKADLRFDDVRCGKVALIEWRLGAAIGSNRLARLAASQAFATELGSPQAGAIDANGKILEFWQGRCELA